MTSCSPLLGTQGPVSQLDFLTDYSDPRAAFSSLGDPELPGGRDPIPNLLLHVQGLAHVRHLVYFIELSRKA